MYASGSPKGNETNGFFPFGNPFFSLEAWRTIANGAIRSAPPFSLRQQGIGTPPFPFPPPGESRGGRVPPTPADTLRGQQKALARIVRRLPPQEGCRPLVDPLRARYAGLGNLRDEREVRTHASAEISRRSRTVYTKYLTLPSQWLPTTASKGSSVSRSSPLPCRDSDCRCACSCE